MSKEKRVTIPHELIECCRLDFKKPIYICRSDYTDYSWLSNKKGNTGCLGCITLDKEYSFELSDNLINALSSNSESNYFLMYIRKGTIRFYKARFSYFDFPSDRKIKIPDEILDICKININKPIYLCYDCEFEKYYLSNSKIGVMCLGAIDLDSQNRFELTDNMCLNLYASSIREIYLYAINNRIYLKKLRKE